MAEQFSGTVKFANGDPIPSARIRLFDKTRSGADDLTITTGISDGAGHFTLTCKGQHRFDFSDNFLPYLHIEYTFHDEHKVHKAFVQPFKSIYRVPDIPPITFIPAKHGFQFTNRFLGYWIPFSVPAIPDIPSVHAIYGLCGGMCAAAYDFLLAGELIPQQRHQPGRARPLHQYLHRRQVDSLDTFGKQVVRFARWMMLSDKAVQKRTLHEFEILRKQLDQGNPTPLGMVYVGVKDTLQIWQNHQVLATQYKMDGNTTSIQVYDPNFPRRNDVHILSEPNGYGGLRNGQWIGDQHKQLRGYFVMPYQPMRPPVELLTSLLD